MSPYFPEYADNRKTKRQIFFEQLRWVIKYGSINDFYFLYGLDIKGLSNPNDFVDYWSVFRSTRDKLNKKSNSPYVVLRDKFLFGIVAEGLGINTPHNIALFDNDKILTNEGRKLNIDDLFDNFPKLDAFVKLVDGECANGVFRLEIKEGGLFIDGVKSDKECLKSKLSSNRWIIQQRIEQHENISAIFQKSINTIRLVTVYDKKNDKIRVLTTVLRVGRGNNHVDNWAAGGLSIGIDENNGTLREFGFYKPGYGTKTNVHPDTHVVFNGYQIPYFTEAVEMAKLFHYYIKGVHSIGWDIAITPQGPCFIEGNDNWEISLMQVCNHGLKKEFNQYFLST